MLAVKVLDFDAGRTIKYHGERHEVLRWLHSEFPETRNLNSIDECVEAINQDGFYEVTVEPMDAGNDNLLPENFHHIDSEDPWPREADMLDDDTSED